jgi:hypothetical protein
LQGLALDVSGEVNRTVVKGGAQDVRSIREARQTRERKLVIASHSRLFYTEQQSPCVSDQMLLIQSPFSAESGLTYVNYRALMWRGNPTTTAGHACMHCLAARRNPLPTYITVFPPNSSRPPPLLFSPPHVCPSCRTERPTSSPSIPSAPLRYVFPSPAAAPPQG